MTVYLVWMTNGEGGYVDSPYSVRSAMLHAHT